MKELTEMEMKGLDGLFYPTVIPTHCHLCGYEFAVEDDGEVLCECN